MGCPRSRGISPSARRGGSPSRRARSIRSSVPGGRRRRSRGGRRYRQDLARAHGPRGAGLGVGLPSRAGRRPAGARAAPRHPLPEGRARSGSSAGNSISGEAMRTSMRVCPTIRGLSSFFHLRGLDPLKWCRDAGPDRRGRARRWRRCCAAGCSAEGIAVDVAAQRARTRSGWPGATDYDAIVLDVMLPGIDGFEVCRRLRDGRRLVAGPDADRARRVDDRVAGLDGGADDYLTKPFSFAELLARLRALVAARPGRAPDRLEVGDLRLDPATRRVWRGETRSSSRRRSSRCSRRSCAGRARCCPASSCSSTPGTTSTRTARTSSTPTSASCARRSTGPSASSSIETVRGAGYRLREDGGTMSRLPIRLRVTLAFAGVMAVVLAALGAVHLPAPRARPRRDDRPGSASRADERRRAGPRAGSGPRRARRGRLLIESEESFAQVLSPGRAGRRRDPAARRAGPASTAAEQSRGARRDRHLRARRAAGPRGARPGSSRAPVERPGAALIVVVGASLDDRDEALASLATLLLIGGPVALLLASLAGYWRSRAALRPVEAMRRRAADDLRRRARRAAAGARGRRRAPPPRRDAERDARPARGGARARAARSSTTPATSCARRSPCTRPSSSSRFATGRSAEELRARDRARRSRRSTG